MTTPTTPEQARELASGTYSFDMGRREFGIALESLATQVEALTAERDSLITDRDEWKDSTIAANENQRRSDNKAVAMQEERDALRAELERLQVGAHEDGLLRVRYAAERDSLRAELEIANAMLKAKLENTAAGAQPDIKELAELRASANALLHQIDIGDFVDSHGHSAKMLSPVHDLMKLLGEKS